MLARNSCFAKKKELSRLPSADSSRNGIVVFDVMLIVALLKYFRFHWPATSVVKITINIDIGMFDLLQVIRLVQPIDEMYIFDQDNAECILHVPFCLDFPTANVKSVAIIFTLFSINFQKNTVSNIKKSS